MAITVIGMELGRPKEFLDLKVVIVKSRTAAGSIMGFDSYIVDKDSGKMLGNIRDFSLNVPMDNAVTVTADFVVRDIEVVEYEDLQTEPVKKLAAQHCKRNPKNEKSR